MLKYLKYVRKELSNGLYFWKRLINTPMGKDLQANRFYFYDYYLGSHSHIGVDEFLA